MYKIGDKVITIRPKQIGVNLGLLKQLPHIPVIVVFGMDSNEINQNQPVTAKVIVDWMELQEDGLTMAYDTRERERLGR